MANKSRTVRTAVVGERSLSSEPHQRTIDTATIHFEGNRGMLGRPLDVMNQGCVMAFDGSAKSASLRLAAG
jgi:hypothetical protein